MKNDPSYVDSRRKNYTIYYNKIKNDVTFKEKVSIQKRQYYIDKKEKLFQIIV